jgi:hypothetical protein
MKDNSSHLLRVKCKALFDRLCELLDYMVSSNLAEDWWTTSSIRALFQVGDGTAKLIIDVRPP